MYFELFPVFETELNDDDRALLSLSEPSTPTVVPTDPVGWSPGIRPYRRWSMVVRLLDAEVRGAKRAERRGRLFAKWARCTLVIWETPKRPCAAEEACRPEEGAGVSGVDLLHAAALNGRSHDANPVLNRLAHDGRDRSWTHGVCSSLLPTSFARSVRTSYPSGGSMASAGRAVIGRSRRALGISPYGGPASSGRRLYPLSESCA